MYNDDEKYTEKSQPPIEPHKKSSVTVIGVHTYWKCGLVYYDAMVNSEATFLLLLCAKMP